jgi:hypothetical protein
MDNSRNQKVAHKIRATAELSVGGNHYYDLIKSEMESDFMSVLVVDKTKNN